MTCSPDDDYYTDTDSNAYSLPTFLGNHDMGRIGNFLRRPQYSGDQLLQRDLLTQSLMFLTRGQPVTYYGDEQGFIGDGGDKDARQDMFASQVASYNDDDLIGTDATTATRQLRHRQSRCSSGSRELSKLRGTSTRRWPTARRSTGTPATTPASTPSAGSTPRSRSSTSSRPTTRRPRPPRPSHVQQERAVLRALAGRHPSLRSDDEGRVTVTVPPLSVAVWKADGDWLGRRPRRPSTFRSSVAGSTVGGRAEVGVAVPAGGFNQVTLRLAPGRHHGLDSRSAPTTTRRTGCSTTSPASPRARCVEYRAVLKDNSGNLSATGTSAIVGDPARRPVDVGRATTDRSTQPANVTRAGDLNSRDGLPAATGSRTARRRTDLAQGQRTTSGRGTFTLPAGDLRVQGGDQQVLGRELRRQGASRTVGTSR